MVRGVRSMPEQIVTIRKLINNRKTDCKEGIS